MSLFWPIATSFLTRSFARKPRINMAVLSLLREKARHPMQGSTESVTVCAAW
jgi:hypothetical protein